MGEPGLKPRLGRNLCQDFVTGHYVNPFTAKDLLEMEFDRFFSTVSLINFNSHGLRYFREGNRSKTRQVIKHLSILIASIPRSQYMAGDRRKIH